jgi:uncharacterized protein (DUF433 family)
VLKYLSTRTLRLSNYYAPCTWAVFVQTPSFRSGTIEAIKMVGKLIQSNPSVMMGKPVIAGTRITVEHILEKLAAGETVEQILDAHPRLTKDAIQAALDFAAKALKAVVVYPVV